jgi:hypothetical protein
VLPSQLTQWRDRAGFSPNFRVLREPLHCIVTQRTCQRQHWIGTLTARNSRVKALTSVLRGRIDRYGARMRSEASSGRPCEVCQ